MIKYFSATDWGWDEEPARVIPLSARGTVDNEWLLKHASEDTRDWLRNLDPIKDHELIHLIAVGDSDAYGYNRNGDGFSEEDNCENHHLFVTNSHLFRNHKNRIKRGARAYGKPVASHHDDMSKRVELVVAAHNKDAGDIIDAVMKRMMAPFSMGTDVAFDVCTVRGCRNRARSPREYCEHARRPNLGRILADGQICGLDNPDPQYFDISYVFKPADRIAYAVRMIQAALDRQAKELKYGRGETHGEMRKAAEVLSRRILVEEWIPERSQRVLRKWAELEALAAMEKRVVGGLSPYKKRLAPKDVDDSTIEALRKESLRRDSLKDVMEALHKQAVLLRPEGLMKLCFGADTFSDIIEPMMDQVRCCLGDVFSNATLTGGDDLVGDSRFDGGGVMADLLPSPVAKQVCDAKAVAGTTEADIKGRIVHDVLIGPPADRKRIVVTKSANPSEAARGLADLYGAYALAFVSHPSNGRHELAKHAVMLTLTEESNS